MRAVLDTNILVSALIAPAGNPAIGRGASNVIASGALRAAKQSRVLAPDPGLLRRQEAPRNDGLKHFFTPILTWKYWRQSRADQSSRRFDQDVAMFEAFDQLPGIEFGIATGYHEQVRGLRLLFNAVKPAA
jgi:hypothetical protein